MSDNSAYTITTLKDLLFKKSSYNGLLEFYHKLQDKTYTIDFPAFKAKPHFIYDIKCRVYTHSNHAYALKSDEESCIIIKKRNFDEELLRDVLKFEVDNELIEKEVFRYITETYNGENYLEKLCIDLQSESSQDCQIMNLAKNFFYYFRAEKINDLIQVMPKLVDMLFKLTKEQIDWMHRCLLESPHVMCFSNLFSDHMKLVNSRDSFFKKESLEYPEMSYELFSKFVDDPNNQSRIKKGEWCKPCVKPSILIYQRVIKYLTEKCRNEYATIEMIRELSKPTDSKKPVNSQLKPIEGLTNELFDDCIRFLCERNILEVDIVSPDDKRYYLHKVYNTVNFIAESINKIRCSKKKLPFSLDNFETGDLHEEQLTMMMQMFNHNVVILTGYPGTGKSHLVSRFISLITTMVSSDCMAVLTPTGKASRVLTKLLISMGIKDIKPCTIDKFHESKKKKSNNGASECIVQEVEILIIDEISMVDDQKLADALKSCPNCYFLLMVGDIAQLKPIEYGQPMLDLSEMLKSRGALLELTVNHRQETSIGDMGNLVRRRETDKFLKHLKVLDRESIEKKPIDLQKYSVFVGDNNTLFPGVYQSITKFSSKETKMKARKDFCERSIKYILGNVLNGTKESDLQILCATNDEAEWLNTACKRLYQLKIMKETEEMENDNSFGGSAQKKKKKKDIIGNPIQFHHIGDRIVFTENIYESNGCFNDDTKKDFENYSLNYRNGKEVVDLRSVVNGETGYLRGFCVYNHSTKSIDAYKSSRMKYSGERISRSEELFMIVNTDDCLEDNEEKYVSMKSVKLHTVKHAWAITTYKSQGGGYPKIIFYQTRIWEDDAEFVISPPLKSIMEDKRCLYTAITRASQKSIIIFFRDYKEMLTNMIEQPESTPTSGLIDMLERLNTSNGKGSTVSPPVSPAKSMNSPINQKVKKTGSPSPKKQKINKVIDYDPQNFFKMSDSLYSSNLCEEGSSDSIELGQTFSPLSEDSNLDLTDSLGSVNSLDFMDTTEYMESKKGNKRILEETADECSQIVSNVNQNTSSPASSPCRKREIVFLATPKKRADIINQIVTIGKSAKKGNEETQYTILADKLLYGFNPANFKSSSDEIKITEFVKHLTETAKISEIRNEHSFKQIIYNKIDPVYAYVISFITSSDIGRLKTLAYS